MVNDISFEAGGQLVVVVEHQSTLNPNMPVRLLIYLGRLYEKMLSGENLYGTKTVPIARPVLIVLYNGTDPYPDESVLKLSDAFAEDDLFGIPAGLDPSVEMTVKVYNINQGHCADKVKKCPTLEGYSIFVEKVREYQAALLEGQPGNGKVDKALFTEAMRRAIHWCIAHGVLKDFLQEHGTEVNNVLFDDWTIEKEKAWAREEGRYAQAADVLAYINAGGTIDGLRERLSRSVSVGSLPASS